MKRIVSFVRLNLSILLILSLTANFALGVVSFVLQPIWRAAAVSTAVAATKATAEVQERAAIAKTKSKEKAKARLKRIITAVPVAGIGAALYFEYGDYQDWLEENPDGDVQSYGQEVRALTQEIADEVLAELPEGVRPDKEALIKRIESYLAKMSSNDGQKPST